MNDNIVEEYQLTQQEIDDGYNFKFWDGESYLFEFENDWVGGDSLIVKDADVKVVREILKENDREFKVSKYIHLMF
jgi:hypothetical protein